MNVTSEGLESDRSEGRFIRSFEDLEAWQFCRALRIDLSQMARSLPTDERFRLTDQIIRAARSATSNLAEGYGRYSFKDNMHFCRQSRGSLYELLDHLTTSHDEGYISLETFKHFHGRCLSAIRIVNGYLRFLHNQQARG